jgi:hypothetical protein
MYRCFVQPSDNLRSSYATTIFAVHISCLFVWETNQTIQTSVSIRKRAYSLCTFSYTETLAPREVAVHESQQPLLRSWQREVCWPLLSRVNLRYLQVSPAPFDPSLWMNLALCDDTIRFQRPLPMDSWSFRVLLTLVPQSPTADTSNQVDAPLTRQL